MTCEYGLPDAFDEQDRADAELVIMAAKAADLKVQWSSNCGDFSIGEPYSGRETRWNPLENDGDALRLAVKLRISPIFRVIGCDATDLGATDSGNCMAYEKYGQDDLAATRRAIVRAAAEIGRRMP